MRMKHLILNFIYSIDHDLYWQDGLRTALQMMSKQHHIDINYINTQDDLSSVIPDSPILYWGNFQSPLTRELVQLPNKKLMVFAAGLTPEQITSPLAHDFDHIFIETEVERAWFRHIGVRVSRAFGVDTQMYKPMNVRKVWDCIYPAAFAVWKRHDLYVAYCKKHNKKGLAIGYMQPNDVEHICYDICREAGLDVLPRVTPDVMPYFYNMSREVVVTASEEGGGLRTLSEAKACGIPVNTDLLNPRLKEAYEEPLQTAEDYYKALWKEVSKYYG